MPPNIISRGFRLETPPPTSSDAEDDSESDAPQLDRFARRDTEVNRNLDLNNRYDPAKYVETPFTRAIINSSRRADSDAPLASSSHGTAGDGSTDAASLGWRVTKRSTSTKGTATPSVNLRPARPGGSIPVATADPGGRSAAFKKQLEATQEKEKENDNLAGEVQREKTGGRKRGAWSGWKSKGVPVVLAPPKKTLKQQVDQAMDGVVKRAAKSKATKAAKEKSDTGPRNSKTKAAPKKSKATGKGKGGGGRKKDDESDKITFTRIPAGAGPDSTFPIVRGLAKLQAFPLSAKAKLKTDETIRRSHLGDEDSDDDVLELDEMFDAINRHAEREIEQTKPRGSKPSSQTTRVGHEEKAKDLSPVARPPDVIMVGDDSQSQPASDIQQFSDDEADHPDSDEPNDPAHRGQLARMREFRNTLLKQNVQYRRDKQKTRSGGIDFDTPSTMTHLSYDGRASLPVPTPSSDLPYSSPLARLRAEEDYSIVKPRPTWAREYYGHNVEMLERMADGQWPAAASAGPTISPRDEGSAMDTGLVLADIDPSVPGEETNDAYYTPQGNTGKSLAKRQREISPETPPPDFKRSRALSPNRPPPSRTAQVTRRLSVVKRAQPVDLTSDDAEEWSTIHPRSRPPAKTEPSSAVKQSGTFRLPLQALQAQRQASSSSTLVPPAPTRGAKASWFRPPPPLRADSTTSIDRRDAFATVTSRGVIRPQNAAVTGSKTRPTFVSDKKTCNQDMFRQQLIANVGLGGQARQILQDEIDRAGRGEFGPDHWQASDPQMRHGGTYQGTQIDHAEDDNDWRSAWRPRIGQQVARASTSTLSRYAYDRSPGQLGEEWQG